MFTLQTFPLWLGRKHSLCSKNAKFVVKLMNCNMHSLPLSKEEESAENSPKKSLFKNISLVTPRTFTKYLYDDLKLKFVESDVKSEAGIEILRNIAANYDYWIVRNNQSLLLYYRLQLLLQRVAFLKTVGLTPIQKLRQIQKSPPILLFSFTDCEYEANMVYLRGMVRNANEDFIHLFYPVTKKVTASKSDIEQRLSVIEDQLQIKQPAILRELLNMPCVFMEPTILKNINHLFIHKYLMPFQYDTDKHTVGIFPPILNLQSLQLSPSKHFSNKANNEIISELPSYTITELLDYSYPVTNGKGSPECLSTFLLKAEKEEEKDRTGGQPVKGRRGFNFPPRQY